MLSMKYAFIAALLLIPVCIIAQVPAEDGKSKDEKVKVIHLDAKRYRAKGEPLLRLSHIKVIPLCADTTQLGYEHEGWKARKVRAVPDKPYTPYLQDFVDALLGGIYVKSGREMLWVIKDLRINTTMFPTEQYEFVRLKADAYVPADNSSQPAYRLLRAFDTVLVGGQKQEKNIAEVIQLFYLSCEDAAGAYSAGASMTTAAIIDSALQPFKAPIFRDTAYKTGIYLTYEEFLANAPAISDFEVEGTQEKKMKIYARWTDSSRKEVTRMWGMCYKGELYKYDAGDLVPIERKANTFVLSQYMDDISRKNRAIYRKVWKTSVAQVVTGVATGILTNGIISDPIPLEYSIDKRRVAKAIPEIEEFWPEATTVDVESGEFIF